MSDVTPIVFVVDDDVSVRESPESLIRCEGWQPETFASAEEFLDHSRVLIPKCFVLEVSLPGLNGLDLQSLVAGERTGLVKNSTAPIFMPWTVIGMSSWPVMKMIGMIRIFISEAIERCTKWPPRMD